MDQLRFSFFRRLLQPGPRPAAPIASPDPRQEWLERFRRHHGGPVEVVFHDNASTMVSSRRRGKVLCLRLHNMFFQADETVLSALSDFLRGARGGNQLLDLFIESHRHLILIGRPRSCGSSVGRRFDLLQIRDALNRFYFANPVIVPVVWGRFRLGRRRSIRLGSYAFGEQVIRIHPALDQDFVPAYVVVGVVYHEMLHHVFGEQKVGGRRSIHPPEFNILDERYVHYARASDWVRQNLRRLLNSGKTRHQRAHS